MLNEQILDCEGSNVVTGTLCETKINQQELQSFFADDLRVIKIGDKLFRIIVNPTP
jgi:hypothetical protein